jgi:hypothetical protein
VTTETLDLATPAQPVTAPSTDMVGPPPTDISTVLPELHASDLVAVHLIGPVEDAHRASVRVGLGEASSATSA